MFNFKRKIYSTNISNKKLKLKLIKENIILNTFMKKNLKKKNNFYIFFSKSFFYMNNFRKILNTN